VKFVERHLIGDRDQADDHRAHLAQNHPQNQAFEGGCFNHLSRLLGSRPPTFWRSPLTNPHALAWATMPTEQDLSSGLLPRINPRPSQIARRTADCRRFIFACSRECGFCRRNGEPNTRPHGFVLCSWLSPFYSDMPHGFQNHCARQRASLCAPGDTEQLLAFHDEMR